MLIIVLGVSMIPVVGIVGGIGSGKSAAALAMQALGGHLIVADALGHEALRQPEIRDQLVKRWGPGILNAAGEADRRRIGHIVFADERELHALEALVFPFIDLRIREEIELANAGTTAKFVILDAAILFETGWDRHCSKVVFIDSPRKLRLARVAQSRGWDEAELARRESRQLPIAEKQARSNAAIVNTDDFGKLGKAVKDTLVRLQIIC
ncbi:MAG: dephospho-CoA kinase [Gemmataceae bacterium]|nr:dephospho-CoA kinase [Gemmataceae bacterium]